MTEGFTPAEPGDTPGALTPGEDDVTTEPDAMPNGFTPDAPAATPPDADEDVVHENASDDSGNADAQE